MTTRRAAGLLVFVLFLFTGVAWACPMCKEALVDPARPHAVTRAAKGYAVSIAALIGMPFLLVGGVAALIVRGHRRAR
jgi:hypothetical protein